MHYFADKKHVAWLSVASNTFLTLIKIIAGIGTGSVSILSEAAHSAIDLVAAMIATFSVHMADRPPDHTHPYGHEKIENLSGVIEGLLIFMAAAWIIFESIDKLIHGVELKHLGSGAVVMAISAGLNMVVATLLQRSAVKNRSVALEADATHLYTDVYTSIGVFAGLFIITLADKLFGIHLSWLDPVIAVGVALLILSAAYRITKKSFHPLLDAAASAEEIAAIKRVMEEFERRGLDFHELRTRCSGGSLHVDLHMGFRPGVSLEAGHAISHELKDKIESTLPGARALIHLEPSHQIEILAESSEEVKCLRDELLEEPRVSEVYHLKVARFRGDLRVEADLQLDPKVTLAESRVLTTELEKRLTACVPFVKDIVLSYHPGDGWQQAIHDDDAERIRGLIGERQNHVAGIHRLEVTSSGGFHQVHLTLGVPPTLPVAEAHLVALHLKNDIQALFAAGAKIDIHIEPCQENCTTCHADCPGKIH